MTEQGPQGWSSGLEIWFRTVRAESIWVRVARVKFDATSYFHTQYLHVLIHNHTHAHARTYIRALVPLDIGAYIYMYIICI